MNRINLICLGVRDIKKSSAFYKSIGFKTYEREDTPAIVFFDNQGSKSELYPLENLARDISAENPPPFSPGGFCGITLAWNMKSKAEVDVFMNRAAQHGGVIVKQPQEVFRGATAAISGTRTVIIGKWPTARPGNSTPTTCCWLKMPTEKTRGASAAKEPGRAMCPVGAGKGTYCQGHSPLPHLLQSSLFSCGSFQQVR